MGKTPETPIMATGVRPDPEQMDVESLPTRRVATMAAAGRFGAVVENVVQVAPDLRHSMYNPGSATAATAVYKGGSMPVHAAGYDNDAFSQ